MKHGWSGALGLVMASLPGAVWACATAPPPGIEVHIHEEEAVIVWDAATKTEHFVRRASFQGAPRDFGFLVPTPTKPELAETTEDLFLRLDQATQPPIVYKKFLGGIEPTALCLGLGMFSRSASVPSQVAVLSQQRVGGYDAVVLEARDAGALASWLKDHGYDDRPLLRQWLTPYVEAGWKLTAFKIAPADAGPVVTTPVRLSFRTERPFFPYREPADSGDAGRLLRVYYFAEQRYEGRLGDGSRPWPGTTELAHAFGPDWLSGLPGGEALGHPRYLTLFEDRSTPRPGVDEVYFLPSNLGEQPRKPREIPAPWKLPLPLDLVALALVGGLLLWLRPASRPS